LGNMTFSINDLYGNCKSILNPNGPHVKFKVDAYSYVYDGSRYKLVDKKNLDFSSTTPTFPFSFTIGAYKTRLASIELYVTSTECSECASGRQNTSEGGGPCYATNVPLGKKVAKPRWEYKYSGNFKSNINVLAGAVRLSSNVPGSCGCIVPF
jgi:hypothetical protein